MSQCHFFHTNPTWLTRARTRASAVRGRRLTALAMARSYSLLTSCIGMWKPNWFLLFNICSSVNIQLNLHLAISSSLVLHPPLRLPKVRVTHGLSFDCAFTALNLVVLFSPILLFTVLAFDSIVKTKNDLKLVLK
jgi:hypothetical protein